MHSSEKMDNFSIKMETFPLLSPVMESELLNKPWPSLEDSQSKATTLSTPWFWEENFQDLSDWCVDPQDKSQFHIPPPFQEQRNYHIGESIVLKNSGVKDNNDNLSNIKSRLRETTGIGDNWTVGNNIESAGMSFEGSMPLGQDQLNNATNISDVWLNLLPKPSIDEQQAIDDLKWILNKNESVTDSNLNLIDENIETWFPMITDAHDTPLNGLVINNQMDDKFVIMDQSTSGNDNSTKEKHEKEYLSKDTLLSTDSGSSSFDLLSYVCEENGHFLDVKNNIETEKSATLEIIGPSQIMNIDKTRTCKKRKLNETKTEAESSLPPLKITIRTQNLSTEKKRASKHITQKDINYADSDSDAHTSDYSYRELREKNNQASRKSRINKKVKETEMLKQASELEKDNAILKMKLEELEKLVTSMRTALLQSALKKEPRN